MSVVGAFTMVAIVASAAREVLTASIFGTGDAVDAFVVALAVPTFLVNVMAGSFGSAFIPVYLHARAQGGDRSARDLFAIVLMLGATLLLLVSVAAAVAAPVLIAPLTIAYSEQKRALAVQLLRGLTPMVFFSGIGAICSAVLNAHERFAAAALSQAFVPICAGIFIAAGTGRWGIFALAAGTVVGAGLQAAVLIYSLHRRRMLFLPRWQRASDGALQRMGTQYGPTMAGTVLMSGTILVDQAMAATLGPGAVASLTYGGRLISPVLNVVAAAVGTAILPYLSQRASRGETGALLQSLRLQIVATLAILTPATAILAALATPIVRLVFQHGAFTSADTEVVAGVFRMYAVQIPFFVAGIFAVRLASALQASHILFRATVANVVVDIVLDYVLKRVLGVSGIALATGVVYAVSLSLVVLMLQRHIRSHLLLGGAAIESTTTAASPEHAPAHTVA